MKGVRCVDIICRFSHEVVFLCNFDLRFVLSISATGDRTLHI